MSTGACEFCNALNVKLVARLEADPAQRVCLRCHRDPRIPTVVDTPTVADTPKLPSEKPLTEDMIRITRDSIGANGRMVRDKPFKAWVGHHGVRDARGCARRFASWSSARSAAREFIGEHNAALAQTTLPIEPATPEEVALVAEVAEEFEDLLADAPRWTCHGRTLSLDGTEALGIERIVDERSNAKLSPVACDAIADYVCTVLNILDLDTLVRDWTNKP